MLDGDGAGFKKTFYFRSYFKAVVGFLFYFILFYIFSLLILCCEKGLGRLMRVIG